MSKNTSVNTINKDLQSFGFVAQRTQNRPLLQVYFTVNHLPSYLPWAFTTMEYIKHITEHSDENTNETVDLSFLRSSLNIHDYSHSREVLSKEHHGTHQAINPENSPLTFPILSPTVHNETTTDSIEDSQLSYPKVVFSNNGQFPANRNYFFGVEQEIKPFWDKTNFIDKLEPPKIKMESDSNNVSSADGEDFSLELLGNLRMEPSYTSYDTDDNSESGNSSKSNLGMSVQTDNIDLNVAPMLTKKASKSSNNSLDHKLFGRDNSDSGNNPVPCLWLNCHMVFDHAKVLYLHICKDHVGKKRPLEHEYHCLWINCKHPITLKRDHLISHIMVHVPLKSFSCDTCDKKFKRSHDVKKHAKTHIKSKLKDKKGSHKVLKQNRQSLKNQPTLNPRLDNPLVVGSFPPNKPPGNSLAFQYHQLQYNYFCMLQTPQDPSMQYAGYPNIPEKIGSSSSFNPGYPPFDYHIPLPPPTFSAFASNIPNLPTLPSDFPAFQKNMNTSSLSYPQPYEYPPNGFFSPPHVSVNQFRKEVSPHTNPKNQSNTPTQSFFNLNSSANLNRESRPEKYSNNQQSNKDSALSNLEKIKMIVITTSHSNIHELSDDETAIIFDQISKNNDINLLETLLQYLNICFKY